MPDVKIVINAEDDTQRAWRALQHGAKSAFDGIATSLIAVTAAVAGATGAMKVMIDQAALAARVETLGVVLTTVGRNAGYSTEQMQGYADSVRRMGITTQESLSAVTRMTQANIDLGKSSQLARIAQDAAVIGDTNSSEALSRLVQGIQSAQIEVLRGIGINVNFSKSYEQLAQKLGKIVDALTEQEKVTARTNVVLEAGKGIAGTYAASMDTVGKQAASLTRYSEEARLKLGELFKPAYAAVITLSTNALKGLNDSLAELNKSGALAKWGEVGASAIRLLVDSALPAAFLGLGVLSGHLGAAALKVAALAKEFTSLEAVIRSVAIVASTPSLFAVGPMLAGMAIAGAAYAGYELGSMYDASNVRERNKERESKAWIQENKEFLAERWRVTQRQLDESGIKGMLGPKALADAMQAGDIVKYQVKVGETVDIETGQIADIIETRFKNVRDELQKTKEQIDATTKGFAHMSTVLDQMGGMSLKLAGDDLRRQIAEEVLDMRALSAEYQALSDTVKTGLQMDRQADQMERVTKLFAEYGTTIDSVYTNQIALQKEVLAEVTNYETKQSNIAKQAASVTETEIRYNEAKLANYRATYDELARMRKTYYDETVKSAANLVKIERDIMAGKKEASDMIYEMWNKRNPAANEMEEWSRKWSRLQTDAAYAATLPIDQQAEAYTRLARSYADMGKVITQTEMARQLVTSGSGFRTTTEFQDVEITRYYDTWQAAELGMMEMLRASQTVREQMAVQEAQNHAKGTARIAEITTAMEALNVAIKATEDTLVSLDNLLATQRMLSIDVSGALSGLSMVRDMAIDAFRILAQVGFAPVSPNGGAGVLGSYATGTDYVPRTGPYLLHQGEAVIKASQNTGGRSINITFGDIVVSGVDKDARQIAREIAPVIRDEIKRLEARS
ncbi:MAG: hypothetical protein LBQ00_06850 [Syntrophobacterales bacterium]|jgi:hypothetical protein|nr:hypothetical protein [Syntrophobacterales bacterium]